jgi:hypothetical protein
MHDIEPHFHWRHSYIASDDRRSPFYGKIYDEFTFSNKIYNYYIHPQWDDFGSVTMYLKLLYADYDEGVAIIELMGEWNDCLQNDIMHFKRNFADHLIGEGINKFILLCENVLNFHGSDDCYYEEWHEDIAEYNGWICLVNLLGHVQEEMEFVQLQHFVHFGHQFNEINWRKQTPAQFYQRIQLLLKRQVKGIYN